MNFINKQTQNWFLSISFCYYVKFGVSRLRLLMSKSADEIIDASSASEKCFFFNNQVCIHVPLERSAQWTPAFSSCLLFFQETHTASLFVECIRVCLSGWINTRQQCLFTSDKSKVYLCNLITYFGELNSEFRCFPQHMKATVNSTLHQTAAVCSWCVCVSVCLWGCAAGLNHLLPCECSPVRQCAGDARVCVAMFAWSTCVYLCALAVTDGALLCQPAACASARGRAGSWSGSWRRRCPSWPAVAAPPPSSTTATLVSVRHPTWSSYPMYPQSSSLCAHRSKSLSLWFI